jgi:ADP-L-glycero-D-manno-heptose 6-epimerase
LRCLVTGGAGFIGSNLAKTLAARGNDVAVADDFSSAHWSNLIDFRGDVFTHDVATIPEALDQLEPCSVIFHQASVTDTTVTDQAKMISNNVEGFRNVLNLALRWGSQVIWASSASIYGQGSAPMKESAVPSPLNVYAYSKLAMEHLADRYRQKLSRPVVGLRYFNVYGPGEDHKGKFASMIHQLARQMRAGKRPRIFNPGDQKRDFVYIDDVIQANLKAMGNSRGGVFNVGSGGSWTFNQVVEELNKTLKTDLAPDYFENPYRFTQDWTQADVTEANRCFGYEPGYTLTQGIERYYSSGALGVGRQRGLD